MSADILYFNLRNGAVTIGHATYPAAAATQGYNDPPRLSYTVLGPFRPTDANATQDGLVYLQSLQRLQQAFPALHAQAGCSALVHRPVHMLSAAFAWLLSNRVTVWLTREAVAPVHRADGVRRGLATLRRHLLRGRVRPRPAALMLTMAVHGSVRLHLPSSLPPQRACLQSPEGGGVGGRFIVHPTPPLCIPANQRRGTP